jgi:hypothetical protein
MNCPKCGNEVERSWQFCPRCGIGFRKHSFSDLFNRVFQQVQKDMRSMEKDMSRAFERDIEAMDISPFFRPAKGRVIKINAPIGSGFSINIVQSCGKQPQVSVKTFGNVKKEDLEKQVQQQIGVKPTVFGRECAAKSIALSHDGEKILSVPKVTEEPKTHIKRIGSGVEVNLELPGVKSGKDIEIKEFESSVEVKALAGDKMYFKILTKPEKFRVRGRKFENGVLNLGFY